MLKSSLSLHRPAVSSASAGGEKTPSPVVTFALPSDEKGQRQHHETRLRADWKRCAQEEGTIEQEGNVFTFLGSEIAT